MDEIDRMWEDASWKKIFIENERNIYQSCVRAEMLHASATWRVRENEVTILRRTEKAMIRATCGVKLIWKRSCPELMDFPVLEETLDRMARAVGER